MVKAHMLIINNTQAAVITVYLEVFVTPSVVISFILTETFKLFLAV